MAEPRHLGYLDALRGYAILGVIVLHVSLGYPDLPTPVVTLFGHGLEGVRLFFVVSAFTLTRSWIERSDGAAPFYVRRVFRIGPMWWLAVLGWALARALIPGHWGAQGVTGWDVLAGVTLTHAWSISAINSVVPGGWSIASEAMFYLIFPLLALSITTTARAVALAILALVLAVVLQTGVSAWIAPFTTAAERTTFFDLWFPEQIPAFAFGIAALHASRTTAPPRWVAEVIVAGALVAFFVISLLDHGGAFLCGLVFGLVTYGMSLGGGRYLVGRVIEWIGQRSYSAYFWHFALLLVVVLVPQPLPLRLLIVLVPTFVLSHASYHLIELPGIRLGKHLLEKWRRRAATGAVPVAFPPA